jgi:hypothetical protein
MVVSHQKLVFFCNMSEVLHFEAITMAAVLLSQVYLIGTAHSVYAVCPS